MNGNLDEGVYQGATVLLFIAAFALFMSMYSIQLELVDYGYKFTRFNDPNQVQTYSSGDHSEKENTVKGSQIIAAILDLRNQTYLISVEGKVYSPSDEFGKMDLSRIIKNKAYKLLYTRDTNGQITQIHYYD